MVFAGRGNIRREPLISGLISGVAFDGGGNIRREPLISGLIRGVAFDGRGNINTDFQLSVHDTFLE
jgi:hypothetical protein